MEVNSSTQTVNVVPSTSSTTSTSTSAAAALELLPPVEQLACSGDPGAMVAALAVQSSNTQREIARSQRDTALQAQAHAQAAEIQDMRTKANLQRAEGIVDGALQIGQGVLDVASGVNDAKAVAQTDKTVTQADKTAIAASKVNAAWDRGGATWLGAGKSIFDGLVNGEITDQDADAKVHDAAAQTFKQIADDAHDSERDAQATIDKAIDFYKEYVDTKAQAAMAAVHRA
jgi:hypothetical protein